MNPPRPLCGLVLAGGRSTRMGTDKADLTHPDGRSLAWRTVDLLASAGCERVIVSIRHDQPVPHRVADIPGVEIIRDPEGKSDGPISGILAAMRENPKADWLVVACDLPRLDAQTLRHLVASRHPGERFLAYRSEFDGLPEPLCAFYASEARDVLEKALADGRRCPRKVLILGNCRLLDPITPRALDNANTPDDWHTAITP